MVGDGHNGVRCLASADVASPDLVSLRQPWFNRLASKTQLARAVTTRGLDTCSQPLRLTMIGRK
jgi:hypothetical protein